MTRLSNELAGVKKDLITNLKPIVIYDPNGVYFTDLPSSLSFLNDFSFPTPLNSYYNTNSKRLYLWYPLSYLEDVYIQYSQSTELAFGVDNNVSVEDESGFIYGFAGNAFQDNNKTEYSSPNKFKVFYNANDSVLQNLHSDIIIEQCYSNGNGFASNSVGNITIKFGAFNGQGAFQGYLGSNENILTIKHLDYVSGINFANSFGGKIVIESINPALLASCPSDMFNTESPAILHLPFYAKGTAFGNYAEANIKVSVPTNKVIYDGIYDARPYRVYTALLTQSGTDAPTAIELENTLGEVTLEYNTVATYKLVSDGLFKEGKTNLYISNGNTNTNECVINIHWGDENIIYIKTYLIDTILGTLTASDEVLLNTSIKIEVYN